MKREGGFLLWLLLFFPPQPPPASTATAFFCRGAAGVGCCVMVTLLGQSGLGFGWKPWVVVTGTQLEANEPSGADASLERTRSAWPWRAPRSD